MFKKNSAILKID